MDSPAWATPASVAVAEDSVAAVAEDSTVAVDSTVAAEAGGNMTTRTFMIAIFAALQCSVAQSPAPVRHPAAAQKTFDSPDAATQALIDAASKNDIATLERGVGIVGQRHSHFRRPQAG